MKTLSVKQPYAWLIVMGLKDIENRTRATSIRGPVLIHASKAKPTKDEMWLLREVCKLFDIACPLRLQYGGIVGQVDIVDCVTESDSEWFQGTYGYVLENAQMLKFKAAKGQLGFFEVNYDAI